MLILLEKISKAGHVNFLRNNQHGWPCNLFEKKSAWMAMLIFLEKINMGGHVIFLEKINMDGHLNFLRKNQHGWQC